MTATETGGDSQAPAAVRIAVRTLIRPSLSLPLPHGVRRGWFELLAKLTRIPDEVRVSEETLGGVVAERVEPREGSQGSVLYLHGGGFVFGSPRTHRSITIPLALASGAAIHALDYRLAPEHPFPAALDDAVAAYRGLEETSSGEPIALAGDSAGGNLAVALTLRARDEGLPLPAAICLMCPLLDLESCGARAGHDSDAGLPRSFAERGAFAYLAGRDPRDPLISPLFCDPSGLPPMLVQTAGTDILRSDAETFTTRAREAGADAELKVFDGVWHDFQAQAGALPAADSAIAEAGEFLSETLTRPRA